MDQQDEEEPLLRGRHRSTEFASINIQSWLSPYHVSLDRTAPARAQVRNFLSSRLGHYCVLALVCLDVSCIFADFVITLFSCEKKFNGPDWDKVLDTLEVVSLVFSCLFVLELIASLWAFGTSYLKSWYHCFDALVILCGFAVDVALRGSVEEAASLIVILRLWRVFKIFEELSVGMQDQMELSAERIEVLEKENLALKKELDDVRKRSNR